MCKKREFPLSVMETILCFELKTVYETETTRNTALSTTRAWVFTWLEAGASMGLVTDSTAMFVTDLSRFDNT